jgi:type II secretory pathway pseudopilin PulG
MPQDKLLTIKRRGRRANSQRPTANDQPHPAAHHFGPRRAERGYILLMLMLFVALLAIAAGALAPTIAFQVRRDREEEMVHRGVQYSRAIRRYVKKTGRYPARLEDLENTNNVRFLRKRYKDPITGEDFKLLHVGEVQLTGVAGIAGAAALGGGTIPGASSLGGGSLNSASLSASNAGTLNAGMTSASSPGAAAGMLLGGAPSQAAGAASPATAGTAADSGEDAIRTNTGSSDPSSNQSKMGQPKTDQSDSGQSSGSTDKLSSQVFGGGPIVGVASASKAASIREFNHKNHYNQWQFIYDPSMDRGGLITTPAQPALSVAAPLQQNNASSSSSSFGQNPSSTGAPGFSTGPQSPPPAQQQQQ